MKAEDILNVARGELGESEHPPGSNHTKYTEWFGQGDIQWCSIFICWCFSRFPDGENLIHVFSAYSGNLLDAGRQAGEEVSISQAGPADVVIFDYGDGGITDHIGFVEKRTGPTSFQTIEGNHNNRVERVNRTAGPSCRMWFVRPKYSIGPKPTPKEDDMAERSTDQAVLHWRPSLRVGKPAWMKIWNDGPDTAHVQVGITATGKSKVLPIAPGEQTRISANHPELGRPDDMETVMSIDSDHPIWPTIEQ